MHTDAAKWADEVGTVAIIGAGTMGEGIAQNFAEAGIAVRVFDVKSESLERCRAQIQANLELAKDCKLMTGDIGAVLSKLSFLAGELQVSRLTEVDVVIETVPEITELKRSLFRTLDPLPDRILLASNTSSMTISSLTGDMSSAHRVVGLHYFNPAHIIPVVEVHHGANTHPSSIERACALLERVGKIPLRIRKEIAGFAINRLTGALSREIAYLLDEDVVSPEALDTAVRVSIGLRLAWVGPLENADYIGLDTDHRVSLRVFKELSNRELPARVLTEKVAAGDLGIKTGRGWYMYDGLTREVLLERRNRRLLRQLAAWREDSR